VTINYGSWHWSLWIRQPFILKQIFPYTCGPIIFLYITWMRFQNRHQSDWCWTAWLERDVRLVAVARSCWSLDSFRVDGLSIHRLLDIHRCCFYFFVSPVWVDIHFVWIDWVRFMSPPILFVFIFLFLIIYINTWHRLESARYSIFWNVFYSFFMSLDSCLIKK